MSLIMSLINFFRKKEKQDSLHTSICAGINGHLSEINNRLAEQNERLYKIEIKQKEINLQLEEIDNLLHGDTNETSLVDALITLTDTIADFYHFTANDISSPLYEQAQMMWSVAVNAAEAAGLGIIHAENEPLDFRFHSAEDSEQDNNIPNGYIIRTLKYGYTYKEEIVRRAVVIVNQHKRFEGEIDESGD